MVGSVQTSGSGPATGAEESVGPAAAGTGKGSSRGRKPAAHRLNPLRRTGRNGTPGPKRVAGATAEGPFVARVAEDGRAYDLTKVADTCGVRWARAVIDAWPRAFAADPEDYCSNMYEALLLWTRWLGFAPAASASARVRSQLVRWTRRRGVTLLDFDDATREFAAALHDLSDLSLIGTTNVGTRNGKIYLLRSFINRMAPLGVLPRAHCLKGMLRASSPTTKTPALAELDRGGRFDWGRGKVPPACAAVVVGAGAEQAALSTPELVSRYASLNEVRREAIRSHLERRLLRAYACKQEGDAILARTDLPTVAEVDATLVARPGGRAMGPLAMLESLEAARPLMGLTGTPPERLRTILVKYVSEKHGGVFKLTDMPYGLLKAILFAGGAKEIVRRLEGDLKALQAAHTIVLVDTGCTIACVDLLPAQPFVGEARRGQTTIRTIEVPKMRAGGSMVEGMLLDRTRSLGAGDTEQVFGVEMPISVKRLDGRLAGAEAIRLWQELSAPIRARAQRQQDGQAELLWIVPHSGSNSSWVGLYGMLAGYRVWDGFLAEIADDPVIGGLRITRRMLRTTWQQVKAVENGLDHVQAQLMGQHASPATTGLYIDAAAIRSMLAYRFRQYLQLYEAAATSTIAGIAARLGMPDEEYRRRLDLAIHTGLAIHCLDTHAGFRPGVRKGEPCRRTPATNARSASSRSRRSPSRRCTWRAWL